MNDEIKTTSEVSGPWECFSDPSYYDMARLRRKDGPKDFFTGFHLNTLREAQVLRDILNRYEALAEIQKLRANLTRAMEIAEEFSLGGVFALDAITASGRWAFEPQNDPRRIIKSANDKLNQLKATLNPTDK